MSIKSEQPRLTAKDKESSFLNLIQLVNEIDADKTPKYRVDSRELDRWLASFVRREPHLAGVLASVTAIDKNRGWKVIGGRNQVKRVTQMLHDFQCSPGLSGWRPSLATSSKSFWSSNIGSITEVGREGKNGPARALYTVDPTKCVLTGADDKPLKYYPGRGVGKNRRVQHWRKEDFFRVVSTPSYQEEMNGLGQSAVYRSIELARTMVAIFRHNQEALLARAPRGLLLLQGISRNQWDEAMDARDVELDNDMIKYFGSIAVLASASQSVDAKLVALSELPKAFNMRDWMDMLLYGYSLCFGYDASEFWPVQYGALGRGNETQIQHEKATGKGRLDFVLGFQEQLQNFLPESIDMTFDQRDEQGDLLHAAVDKARADVVKLLYEAQPINGNSLITTDEGRVLLAEYGLIPSAWAPTDIVHSTDLSDAENEEESPDASTEGQDEDPGSEGEENPDSAAVTSNYFKLKSDARNTRLKLRRQKLLENDHVIEAARRFPNEPIVQYDSSTDSVVELWSSGESLLKPKFWIGEQVDRNNE